MVDNNDSAEQFEVTVAQYLRRNYGSERRGEVLLAGGWDATFAAELAVLGWFALAVPDAHEGIGAPLSALGPIFIEFGRYLVVGPMLENTLLPALLTRPGEWDSMPAIAAAVETGRPLALVDPGITDDWAEDVGSVVLTEQGLHGSVSAVRFGAQAELLVVIADSGNGSVLCFVDPNSEGVLVESVDSADPATAYARIFFDGARTVGPYPRVHGDDHVLVNKVRSWARLLIACELSGIAARSLDRTVEYIGQREQFGRPVGSFQAVKHIAANMYERSTALHNLCMAAVSDANQADDHELYVLAAATKAYAADAALRVCEDAIQLHGGIGFTTENELHWYYKHALALRGWYGDETELELRVGAALLDPPQATIIPEIVPAVASAEL